MEKITPFCEDKKIKTKAVNSKDFMKRLKIEICWNCGGKLESFTDCRNVGQSSDGSPIGQEVTSGQRCVDCGNLIIHNQEVFDL